MIINASVGNAPMNVTLSDKVYSLNLRAETDGEKQRLAALFAAISDLPEAILRAKPPTIVIREIWLDTVATRQRQTADKSSV